MPRTKNLRGKSDLGFVEAPEETDESEDSKTSERGAESTNEGQHPTKTKDTNNFKVKTNT